MSIPLTNAYRTRLLSLERRVATQARSAWPTIETFDDTNWPQHIGTVVTRAQTESVRATAGYMSALLRSNRKPGRVALDTSRYAGVSRDGRPITEALQTALIGVTAALKDGREPPVALSIGLSRGLRMAQFETIQAGRDALLDATDEDERFTGWQRSVQGTCAACMALSGGVKSGPQFEVHEGCQCVPQPTVTGVTPATLPTGSQLFARLSKKEQDAKLGPEAAELVRSGKAELSAFVKHENREVFPQPFITQKPVQEVPKAAAIKPMKVTAKNLNAGDVIEQERFVSDGKFETIRRTVAEVGRNEKGATVVKFTDGGESAAGGSKKFLRVS